MRTRRPGKTGWLGFWTRRAALALCALSALALASSTWWGFDLVGWFRMHLAVALVCLSLPSLIERRFGCFFSFLAMASIDFWFVAPYFVSTPMHAGENPLVAAAGPSASLSVLVVPLPPYSEEAVTELARVGDVSPDLAVFLRVDDAWADALALLGPVFPEGVLSPGEQRGLAVLSRHGPCTSEDISGDGRIGELVRLRLEVGEQRLTVYAADWPLAFNAAGVASIARSRDRLIEDLLAEERGALALPVLVVGGFGSVPWSDLLAPLFEGDVPLLRHEELGFDATWPAKCGVFGCPLIGLWARGDVRFRERRVLSTTGSWLRPLEGRAELHPCAAARDEQ